MWKKYKTTLILTTLISLFPMVIGLLLWNRMPDTIATHFGTNNVPNGWSSKTMAVIGIPLFLAALQIFTAVLTFSDPKRQNIGPKMIRLVLWIIPVTSLIICCSIYANAVGIAVDIGFVSNGIVGLLFILIGNYMPKCKQNYTTGIKVPWTLHSQENWNRTHRLAGWVWIIGGVLVELDVGAVLATDFLLETNDDATHDIALLDLTVRSCLLDAADDDIAQAGITALRTAENLDALDFLRTAVVSNSQH